MLIKENTEDIRDITFSFYGTVYNAAKYIEKSLKSIIDTAVKLKSYGIESEIVIVDNYSDDGTWEMMQAMKREYNNYGIEMKFVRHKCSRGTGRNIALRIARGKYLFYVDLDVEYEPENMVNLILNYLTISSSINAPLCFYIYIVPKEIALKVEGISDLNRTEDIEFCAKLSKECIIIPLLKDLEPVGDKEFMKPLDINSRHQKNLLITTYASERRYAKNFLNYLHRELRNKIDMIRGMGYGNPETIIRECVFLRNFKNFKALLCVIYHLFFLVLTKILRKNVYTHDYIIIINNGSLCDIAMTFNYSVLISKVMRGQINISSVAFEEALSNIKRLVKSNSVALSTYIANKPEIMQHFLGDKFFLDLFKSNERVDA